jgi:hypothetical protein
MIALALAALALILCMEPLFAGPLDKLAAWMERS